MIPSAAPADRPWALVTGASSGIGQALAEGLAERGYNLLLVGRDQERLGAGAAGLAEEFSVKTLPLLCDLRDPQAGALIAETVTRNGITIELLVNNAGFGIHGPYDNSNIEQAIDLVQVQLLVLLQLTRAVLPQMRRLRRGHILNVASVYSHCPVPDQAVYSACKAFMFAFSSALRAELRNGGVNLTVVAPGITRTNFRARMGQTESRRVRGMTAKAVATAALAGLFAGKFHVVPGLSNRIFVAIARHLPLGFAPALIRQLNRWRGMRTDRSGRDAKVARPSEQTEAGNGAGGSHA